MLCRVIAFGLIALLPVVVTEPAPRTPAELPIRINGSPGQVSAAAELPDGLVLLTDAKRPAISLLDPKTGAMTVIGSAGVGDGQYVRPGGIYGTAKELLVLDRAQTRVLVYSAAGAFVRAYSIAVNGVTTSSEGIDLQRLDALGNSYFADRAGSLEARLAGGKAAPAKLIRFDPVKQQRTAVSDLRQPETKIVPGGDGMVFSRSVVGSPADGFGVAPDGRVAVVRADPYRVEWVALDGRITQGPIVEVDTIPITDADKAAHKAKYGSGPGIGVGGAGASGASRSNLSGLEPTFAATKAPFEPGDVVVSPEAFVWVLRSRPADAASVIYDVFDRTGRRVDRLEFPAGGRVAGFGPGSVFMTGADRATLKKYKVR